MPYVTLEHIYPATYVQAPVSALYPNLPSRLGATGILGLLDARYGSHGTRQICVFMGDELSFHTSPGSVTVEGNLLTHTYRSTSDPGVLRHPLRDDLSGEYLNVWHLTGDEICDPQQREAFLEAFRARWRVLRRATL